jgi:hypothetical protein
VTAGTRARLEELEGSELGSASELQVVLCWLVQDGVTVDHDTLNAARRRAMFVLAAGGDPHRDVGPDSAPTRSPPSVSPTSSTRPSGARSSPPHSTGCRPTTSPR